MGTIRVLLTHMPPLLRQILQFAMARDTAIQVISEDDVTGRAMAQPPDAVVVSAQADAEAMRWAAALLDRWPRAKILVFTAGGRAAALHELIARSRDLGELSPAEAVEEIRDAVRRATDNGRD